MDDGCKTMHVHEKYNIFLKRADGSGKGARNLISIATGNVHQLRTIEIRAVLERFNHFM